MTHPNQRKTLAERAKTYILANMGEDKLFPPIDDGNMGVCAYIVSLAPAGTLLALAKDLHPGVPIAQSFVFHPTMHSVVVVVTSEDEPHLILVAYDHATLDFIPITDINLSDLSGAFPEVFKRHLPDITEEYPDDVVLLTRLLGDGQYIDLGEGAAEDQWWT